MPLCHLKVAQRVSVAGQTLVQRFGEPLAIFRALHNTLVMSVADETDLRQHRGHRSANQYHKRSALDPAVPGPGIALCGNAEERRLDTRRKFARIFHLVLEGYF